MSGLIAITVSILPFLWLFYAFELVSFEISVLIFSLFLIAVLAFIAIKVRKSKAGPRVRGMRIAQTARKAVMDNIHMLAVNQKNLIKLDDYGNSDDSAVVRDMGRFVNRNIEKVLGIELDVHERKKLFEIIKKETKRYRRNNPSLFVEYDHSMDQATYETFCESLLKVDGWKTRFCTAEERGMGVDLIGEKEGMVVAFQIRKSDRPIGNRGVVEINDGKENWQAVHAVIISNEEFVSSARQLASSLGVELWHHSDVGEGFR